MNPSPNDRPISPIPAGLRLAISASSQIRSTATTRNRRPRVSGAEQIAQYYGAGKEYIDKLQTPEEEQNQSSRTDHPGARKGALIMVDLVGWLIGFAIDCGVKGGLEKLEGQVEDGEWR